MRRPLIATALILAFAAPAASAATVFVIHGRGFGHGVGMSQYGALGYAHHGVGYRRILSHYYRGTTLGAVGSSTVRVLLQQAGSVAFANASSVNGKALNPGRSYVATPSGGGTDVRDSSGHEVQRFGPGALYVTGAAGHLRLLGPALNGTSDGDYRGQLELAAAAGGLDAIDVVGLEDYVAGVVPGEVIPSWPAEALKTQAVAARTYALATHASGLFDQYADTRSQEYKGMDAEQSSSNAAVRATAGQVVVYRGRIATTFFFSTSGGRTEDVQNVMYGSPPEPYLVSVNDPYEGNAPLHKWRFRWSRLQLQAKLGSLCSGSFERIRVLRRGRSPRIVSANVVCTRGKRRVTGVALKESLGLYDTWFYATRIDTRTGRRARVASFVTRLLIPPLALTGAFDPAPPERRLTVERQVRGRFVAVGTVATATDGSFYYSLRRPGTYRVSYGDTDGPAVSVR